MSAREKTNTPESIGAAKGGVAKLMAAWIVLPLFFLVTGGSFDWWEAWAYCAVLLVPMTFFLIYMASKDPEFIARRFKLKEKEQTQRRVLVWGYPSIIAAFILPGLDHRLGWSEIPIAVVIAASTISFVSYLSILWVFIENRWAGRTVETYTEQKVISTGPYAFVRHPMYAGTIALYLATPVALGSWWAVLPVLTFIPIYVMRILNEEEVLARELPGYKEYRSKVRYRLVPFIW